MADPARSTHSPGESSNHDVQSTSQPAPEASGHAADGISNDPDSSLPPVDPALSADTSLPPLDPSLPSIDSTIPPVEPSLPGIDTSLPPIDTTLPAAEAMRPAGTDAEISKAVSIGSGATGVAAPTSNNGSAEQAGSHNSVASAQGTNGVYHQSQHPPQQQQHSPPQQQPQQAQFQQQNPGMVHNSQTGPPPMNTGSMQTGGHIQGQQIPQAPIGSPLTASMPPMGQYMGGYSSNMPQMGANSNAQMHYQMQGDASSILSAQRHKKEVKRRTKTGCLTCRKRRIKCDEGHPVCRNCVKSKRECLGYDPVFRPPPTPSTIQPAPNPSPSLVVNPQDPSYSAAPPGYVPAVSQSIPPSHHSESPTASTDYGTTVDPALEGSNTSNMAGVQDTEGTLQSALNPSATSNTSVAEHSAFRLKQVRISDLLALKDVAPPPHHPIAPLSQRRLDEIQAVFVATYGQGLDKLMETKWYEEKALTHLMADAQLMAEYSALIDAYNDPNLPDPNVVARLESFEASVIWSTMMMCRRVAGASNGNQGQDYDLMVALNRLNVIEALITGDHLETNPLAQFPARQPASNPPTLPEQLEERSLEFWRTVGQFLTLHDNEASAGREIDDTLGRTRTLLDTFENRDVIYSIAIARHVGQRWADFPHSLPQPITTNERDAGAKLYVAQKFLEQEANVSGTTQVMKRICGMVVRSWYISRE